MQVIVGSTRPKNIIKNNESMTRYAIQIINITNFRNAKKSVNSFLYFLGNSLRLISDLIVIA